MPESSPTRRLIWTVGLSAAVVGVAVLRMPQDPSVRPSAGTFRQQYDAVAKRTAAEAKPHRHGDAFMEAMLTGGDGQQHNHNDPATKNALSRGDLTDPAAQDPTTPAQARIATASVARERVLPEPTLVPGFTTRPRLAVPEDRYAMAGGCYTMRSSTSGGYVHRVGPTPSAAPSGTPEPLHFQATHLGRYLLFGTKADYLGTSSLIDLLGSTVSFNAAANPASDWTVDRKGSGFAFTLPTGKGLVSKANGELVVGTASEATAFQLRTTTGCAAWPEIQTNVSRPFKSATSMQETRGLVDLHSHGMTHEFLGGMVMCGKPWDPYGVTVALVDCPDHSLTAGYGAVLETFLSGGTPGHDTVGWPTFNYWPNPHSLTHESLYYKWLERSWRGGLRIFTNLLTENNVLCELYPLKKNSCNDMDAIRLQAEDMRDMQDYVDAQYGGPGRGWYRIVKNPFEARSIVNQGKLAVIMGIETSVPFDCNVGTRQPQCTKASIDKSLDEVYRLGVRQMEITNKFDNGLTGVAGDQGTTGVLTNFANFVNTGSWLRMEACPSTYPAGVQDNQQVAAPDGTLPEQDAIFGAIAKLWGSVGSVPAPVYTSKPQCNQAGLTPLGQHLLSRMIDKGMLFDPDHMSVLARKQALDLLERAARDGRHPGVLSSHSWSTPDAYPRIYKLGGVITPYAGDSKGFLAKWKQHLKWRDPRYYFGFGYGADINGFGAQGDARHPSEANDVDYPFTGLGGVRIDRERGGQRVWDINSDGVAHYGLYPDWVQDVRVLAGSQGSDFMSDMSRGPEAYLQMWERTLGVSNDGCRDPRALKKVRAFRGLHRGLSTTAVLKRAGQPHARLGTTYSYCAKNAAGKQVRLKVVFTPAGRVSRVLV
jgi:hypothetical protein